MRPILGLAILAGLGTATPAPEPAAAYRDPKQPLDRRVHDLVSRMTLEEKCSQLVNHTRAVPRLGVPEYDLWSEALHGVAANGTATVPPQAIGLAATFDAPLIHEMAQVTALEGRAKHNMAVRAGEEGALFKGITFFSPNINLFRDPRWGRHGFDAVVSKHDLEDTYLPAFRAAVVEGKVRAVMCVYNAVNGVPGCASEDLLQDALRKSWGFSGFVTGDCDAVRDIYTGHKDAKSLEEAAVLAIKAGTDNDCQVVFGPPGTTPEYPKYVDAVKRGLLPEADVDRAVERMMRTRFELGLFDAPELDTGVEQLPEFTDYSMAKRTYRYFAGEPLYPFGFGLSYSTFAYSGLRLSSSTLAASDPLQIQVEAKNTSARAGDEVVQAYLVFPEVPGAPRHALRGFTRLHLRAGESRPVRFDLRDRDLGHVDESGTHKVPPGAYRISVGGGQPGRAAGNVEAAFTITGERVLPR